MSRQRMLVSIVIFYLCSSLPVGLARASELEELLGENTLEEMHAAIELEVESLYDLQQRYILGSGKESSFAVSDFFTLTQESFEAVSYHDILDPPGGLYLERSKITTRLMEDDLRSVLDPEWVESEVVFEGSPTFKMSLLYLEGDMGLRADSVLAVTSFRVSAWLDGQSRTYRAGMLWLRGEGKELDFSIVDNVGMLMPDDLSQLYPPADRLTYLEEVQVQREELLLAAVVQPEPDPTRSKAAPVCSTLFERYPFDTPLDDGREEHAIGKHFAKATGSIFCACDSACKSSCVPVITEALCREEGVAARPGAGIVFHARSMEKHDDLITQNQQPAQCAIGYACVVKSCDGFCNGPTISVNVGGGVGLPPVGSVNGAINFVFPQDSVIWNSDLLNYGVGCPPCLRLVQVGVNVNNLAPRQDAVFVTLRDGGESQRLLWLQDDHQVFEHLVEENDTVRLEVDSNETECRFAGNNPSIVLTAGKENLNADLDCGENHGVRIAGEWRDQPADANATLTINFEPPPGSWRSGYAEQVRLPDGFNKDLEDLVSNNWSYSASIEVAQGQTQSKCSVQGDSTGTITAPLTLDVLCEPDCDATGSRTGEACSGPGSVTVQLYREPSFGDDNLDPGADITTPLQVQVTDVSSNSYSTFETTVSVPACATPSAGCFHGSWQVPYPDLEVGDRVSLQIVRSSVVSVVQPATADCGLSDRIIPIEGDHLVTLTCGDRGRLGNIDYERNPGFVRPNRPLALDFRLGLPDPHCRMRATIVRSGGYTHQNADAMTCIPNFFGPPQCFPTIAVGVPVPVTERIQFRTTCFRPPSRAPGEPVTTATSNFVEGWQLPQPELGSDYFAVGGVTFGPTVPSAIDLVFTTADARQEFVPIEVRTGLPSATWCGDQMPAAADCGANSGFFALFHQPGLAVGQHELLVFAIDGHEPYNTWGRAEVLIEKQIGEPCAPPELSITSPQDGAVITVPTLDIRGSVSGSGSRLEMFREFSSGGEALLHTEPIDEPLPLSFSIPYTVRQGTQTLRVEATNDCGATARERLTFSGDLSGSCTGVTAPQMVFAIDGSTSSVAAEPGQRLSLVAHEAAPAQGSLSHIELWVDGALFGTFPATDGTPWRPMVPTTLSAGPHQVEVRGYRLVPGSTCTVFGTAAVTLDVSSVTGCSADELAPEVAIISPTAGATGTAGQPWPIAVSASDTGGVDRIEVTVDDGSGPQPLASQSFPAAPLSADLQTPWTPGEGTYQVVARAVDVCGNTNTDQVTVSTVSACAADSQPPQVSITSPAAAAQYGAGEIVTFEGVASDNLGVQRVEVLASGAALGTAVLDPLAGTWSLSWTASEGWHQISARAIDSCGLGTTSSAVPVTVSVAQPCGADNRPPSLSLGVDPDRLPPLSTAELSAGVSDPDGDPLSVCFSSPTQNLGCVASPPFRTTWDAPDTNGIATFDLTAEVSDGCETRSATVQVTVDPCGDPLGPDVVLSSPDHGIEFEDGQFIHFRARATDPHQVGAVDFYYDSELIGTRTTAETTATGLHLYKHDIDLPFLGLENGQRVSKTLKITARPPGSACQNSRTDSVTIEILGGRPDPDPLPE